MSVDYGYYRPGGESGKVFPHILGSAPMSALMHSVENITSFFPGPVFLDEPFL